MAQRSSQRKTVEPSRGYAYLQIADAKKTLNMRVNLFAKISEVGFPRKTKGTDYVIVLKVIDQSCPPPGISVTFFAENTKKLPNVRSAGDMICLHQVEMKNHNGEIYCLYGKKMSSFALFSGKTNRETNPYQTSPKYHAKDHVDDLLLQLSTLSLERQLDAGFIKRLPLLRNIEIGKTFDLICKVFHVCEISKSQWMLFAWDGTDSPPATFQTNLDMEKKSPSPLYIEPLPLAMEILCSFPRVGTILRIFANKFFEDIHHIHGGDNWVNLYNVTCELQSGMWKGVVDSSSKAFRLSKEDDRVKYRERLQSSVEHINKVMQHELNPILNERLYAERQTSKLERMPSASFPEPSYITETDHKNAAYATLMDSMTRRQVTHKFKCVVRVVASLPWRGEDLQCPIDGHYRIRLTLEDPTARVHAYIYKEDGVKFFGGHPTAGELNKKMSKLLGIKEAGSSEDGGCTLTNPPWIWCCIKSYYLNEKDPLGSRRYRIFDTRVVD